WYSASGTAAPRARKPASTTDGRSRRSRGSSTVAPLPLHPRQAHHAIVGLDVDDADAPRVAPLGGDVLGAEPDQLPLGRHEQDVVALAHLDQPDHKPVTPARLDVEDPLAAAPLEPVFLERRLLPVAPIGHREDGGPLQDDLGRDDGILRIDVDALDAGGGPAHRADLLLAEPDGH